MNAIYTMLEDEIEGIQNYWEDENYVDELGRRTSEFKSGKIVGLTWDEAKTKIISQGKKG